MKPLCVRHRTGWCKVKDQKVKPADLELANDVETACGYVVTLPWGVERRAPDCVECNR